MKKLLAIFGLMAAMALSAQAHLIKIDEYLLDGSIGNPTAELAWVEGITGFDDLIDLGKTDTEVPSGTTIDWDYTGDDKYPLVSFDQRRNREIGTGKDAITKHLYALYAVSQIKRSSVTELLVLTSLMIIKAFLTNCSSAEQTATPLKKFQTAVQLSDCLASASLV